jgi:plastocyanin
MRLQYCLLALVMGGLAACTSTPQPAAPTVRTETPGVGTPEVRIIAREFEFSPINVRIPANQQFTLVLDNSGGVVEHDVDVPALGGLHIHAMPASESRITVSVSAPPGNYQFACTLPGHRSAGMRGTITVTSS